jgi:hypothetical protein
MENYYKITPAQAALIGKFNYSTFEAIDPFVGEQKDGSYLVSETVYNLLKERTEIKKVDFTKLTKIPDTQAKLDVKETDTIIPK